MREMSDEGERDDPAARCPKPQCLKWGGGRSDGTHMCVSVGISKSLYYVLLSKFLQVRVKGYVS